MVDEVITKQELIDAKVDAQTFGEAANGAPGVKVKARLGRVYWTLATYDKRFNDRADSFDRMYVDYDSTLATKAKAFDDSLVEKNKEFDDSLVEKNKEFDDARNTQITKYDNTLAVKVKAFDDSLVNKNKEFDDARNKQISKYNQTMDDRVVEYDLKIDSVDADLRGAIDTANAAKTTADNANTNANSAKTTADAANTAISTKLNRSSNLSDVINIATARTNLDVYSKAESNNLAPTVPNATETVAGKAKIATTAIAQGGTNDTDFLTPKKLRDALNASGEAPIYACRAWATFSGSANPTIVGGGNISSVTRVSAGVYRLYFLTPMLSDNYAVFVSAESVSSGSINYFPNIATISQLQGSFVVALMPSTGTTRIDGYNFNVLVMAEQS